MYRSLETRAVLPFSAKAIESNPDLQLALREIVNAYSERAGVDASVFHVGDQGFKFPPSMPELQKEALVEQAQALLGDPDDSKEFQVLTVVAVLSLGDEVARELPDTDTSDFQAECVWRLQNR